MKIYFAPMEGITDVLYRRAHHDCFSGIDKYFIPFISPTHHLTFSSKEQKAVSPVLNAGIPAIPQILTKVPEHFLWMANAMLDAGFPEINLNMGCPSGTVTTKGKGAGMLQDQAYLEKFLDEIFAKSPLPISLKTRIGFADASEWDSLWKLLSRYPAKEIIIHPRTKNEMYKGIPHRDLYADTAARSEIPCVYNGDLRTLDDCNALMQDCPNTSAVMLGRGLVANPALASDTPLTREILRHFHDTLFNAYMSEWPKSAVVGHMHEIMTYVMCCFEEPVKPRKALRKVTTVPAYLDVIRLLFDEYPLRENPCFVPFLS